MTAYAFFEAVFLAGYAGQRGFVMLTLENRHVVTAYELRIVNTAVALSPGNDGHRHTFRAALVPRRVQQAVQASQYNQCQNQDQ
jgi:hypothetical protein